VNYNRAKRHATKMQEDRASWPCVAANPLKGFRRFIKFTVNYNRAKRHATKMQEDRASWPYAAASPL